MINGMISDGHSSYVCNPDTWEAKQKVCSQLETSLENKVQTKPELNARMLCEKERGGRSGGSSRKEKYKVQHCEEFFCL